MSKIYINGLKALLSGVIISAAANVSVAHADDVVHGPGHGPGPGPGGPPSPENEAIQARLGDTSSLMGSIAIPESVESCGTDAGFERLVCLIDILKADVSDEILELLQLEYSLAEAKNWSNLPAGAFPARPGVFLGELDVEQRGVVKAILMEATGLGENEGFDEIVQTLNADDYIGTVSTDYKAGYSSFNGKIAFLGTPADKGTWQLYYGGHHFAFANTYTDGKLVGATPSFRGIEPFPSFEMNGRTNIPMLQERDAFAALLNSLTSEQKKAATLEGTYRDILAGPQADDGILDEQEGISVRELTEAQKDLLLAAVATYVEDINAADAKHYMEKYTSELDETVLGFSGTTDVNSEDDYVRIHGPSLWIEFSLQSNKSTPQKGNHPHSVWRDITDDYGAQTE
ncbi:DUF3500 domain-containing protein [Marinomonas dokdonensis]|uniref:DUF3500 domain-containing protein n=1 Tax=Marinomonas dokdonensis TaxID=328224 RepID=UPI004055745A